MLDAMFDYLTGKEPLLMLDGTTIFAMLRPFLDEERDKRIRLAERSKENGKKGGRKAKNLPKPKKPTGFASYLELDEYKGRSEKLKALDAWKQKHTPYIYANIRPLTQREFECLHPKYNSNQICDTLKQIENRKDLRKRYTDPYRTLLNWLKKEYGDTGANNG